MTRALVLLLLAAACRPDCTPEQGKEAPIVLLVTVDTLRADHLGAYGSARVHTPEFDRLAAESLLFERAYAQASITLPSHVSLLTSTPLATHGVLSNKDSTPPEVATLPGEFARAGYHTAAFVSAYHLGPQMVLGRMLDRLERFEAPERISHPRRADDTTDRALAWIRGVCREPTFAWIHLWDPHMPYTPPSPFDRTYYRGDPRDPAHDTMAGVQLDWALYDLSKLRVHLGPHAGVLRDLKQRFTTNSRGARRLLLWPDTSPPGRYREVVGLVQRPAAELRRELPYGPGIAGFLEGLRDLEYPRAQYAGEVSWVDSQVGRLRDTLVAWGLTDRTILVVTADHGEGLGEHGVYFSHVGTWEEMLHVPMLVWAPGRLAPARRSDLASGLDVAPTLLQLAALAPPPTMQGRDLVASHAPAAPLVLEQVKGTQVALRDDRWKLVRTLHTFRHNDAFDREAGTIELYDVVSDPGERTDRARDAPAVATQLGAILDRWLAAHQVDGDGYGRAARTTTTPEQRDRLRALGYAD
ncbi:MAG TPA: sulfatase [Candidatus Eisenbacteria bacterium]|nr:sulfatase [Candidatus Eisenbacteria bacterium]